MLRVLHSSESGSEDQSAVRVSVQERGRQMDDISPGLAEPLLSQHPGVEGTSTVETHQPK